MEEMIRAEHLSYEYVRTWEEESGSRQERIQALDDLSLSIEKGSFVAVLGHNGSGKSTFAKEINALLKPTVNLSHLTCTEYSGITLSP